jgi:hypothetical protein
MTKPQGPMTKQEPNLNAPITETGVRLGPLVIGALDLFDYWSLVLGHWIPGIAQVRIRRT